MKPGDYKVVIDKALLNAPGSFVKLSGRAGKYLFTYIMPTGVKTAMKHSWVKNTDPLYRPHRRCDNCALIEEVLGDRKIYHRGGLDVPASGYPHGKQPPCK